MYFIFKIPFYFLSLLPFWFLYFLSDILYILFYNIFKYRLNTIKDNIYKCFPDKSEKEKDQIIRNYYKHLFDIIVEAFKLLTISSKTIQKRYIISNIPALENCEKGFLFMAHYANWEWGNSANLWLLPKAQVVVVFQKLSSPFFNKLVYEIRSKFKMKYIQQSHLLKEFLTPEKIPTYYVVLTDLSPNIGMIRHHLTFLGRKTPVHIGVERLIFKYNAPCYFLEVQKIKRGYYKLDFRPLIYNKQAPANTYPITTAYFEKLENIILKDPNYWIWSHRRWKYVKE